ncbi:MAG: TonB-dependent receptor [Steroidobacteraceae bacterium]|nr:TonB-dependent receptor [Steroidobacteraceae bacterium]
MNRTFLLGGIAAAISNAALAAEPHASDLQEIVVTAAPIAARTQSMSQPASVLAGDALALALAPTIGETVAREPGVHATFFGPAASRPVIRGLGGDRVQVLTDGLANLDASGISEDHAVAIDPALADQVEVLRGPATLLYGSGTAGGLVNVVTNRLHEELSAGVHGLVELRGDSALAERAIAGRVDGGARRLMLHLDGVWRETDDFEVPRRAGGKVPDSWSESRAGGAGASWIGERATFGVAFGRHDAEYGIPNEEGLYVDLKQDRADFAARIGGAGGGWALRLRGAASDYEHAEIEADGEVGTRFQVDAREMRAAFEGALPGGTQAIAGVQWQDVDLVASGEEAFVPGSRTRATGLFAFGRRAAGPGSLELGLRADRQEIDAEGFGEYRDEALNASLGLTWPVAGDWDLVGQLVRSERHPSATELFADGPHAATQQFEIGDPGLSTERAWTADLGLRRGGGRVQGEIRAFASRYDGYIFLAPTGEFEDGLPVFAVRQAGARFHGFEAAVAFPFGPAGSTSLTLSSDYVRARLDGGGSLPRIPPLRAAAELAWRGGPASATVTLRHHFTQDRIAELETETASFTMLDASVAWRPDWGHSGALLFLKATNLLDQVARPHTSPLKDTVPLPGRSIAAGIRIAFGREGS